jgi:hypothetical protein
MDMACIGFDKAEHSQISTLPITQMTLSPEGLMPINKQIDVPPGG